MDPRVAEHARLVVEHATDVRPGETVLVQAPAVAEDLVVALHERLGELGAHPLVLGTSSRAQRAYLRAAETDRLGPRGHALAAIEASDVVVDVRGARNVHETGDVPPETTAAHARVGQPLRDALADARWLGTQYPAPGDAQAAGMSTAAYEDFVWGAINRDWDAQRAFQQQLVDLLDPADEVRLVAGDATDLTMSIAGNPARNAFGQWNLPDGEVFTAPVPDSVEGEVRFDLPALIQGREVTDVHLAFEAGEVTAARASAHEDVLRGVLDTDPGARRLGELGLGMNRAIDRFTRNVLFDEKLGGTVHLALGAAFEGTVGEGSERNDSAVHQDLLLDANEDAVVEVDGEVVQRNGTFAFEEGFEG